MKSSVDTKPVRVEVSGSWEQVKISLVLVSFVKCFDSQDVYLLLNDNNVFVK
jgi:hypothetical protein